MARPSTRMHAVAPRETLDRAAFAGAFLIGVVGGIALKEMGAHALVSSVFAAFILVLYAISAWAGGRIKIEPETIGDNCYYLGFLFTLASLSYTLYQLGSGGGTGPRAVDLPEVISGFGVALSSTIVGVFLRVLMMQMRPDFIAKDKEVRADVNRSYLDFRRTMSGILSQMKAFSAESVQMAAERDARIRSSTEKFTSDHHEALKGSVETLAKNMEQVLEDAAKMTAQGVNDILKQQVQESQSTLAAFRRDMQSQKEEALREEKETLAALYVGRGDMLAQLGEALSAAKDQSKASSDLVVGYEQINAVLGLKLGPTLNDLSAKLDGLATKVDATTRKLEKLQTAEDDLFKARGGIRGFFARIGRNTQ